MQEFLNRSTGHLWAILSNGLRFRILRDNQALSRQSYLEFDLDAMFSGEVFPDFVLLWLMAHATRFAPRESNRPETCWLEQWTKLADEQGTRALGELRQGVEKALEVLGQGFVGHPRNAALREALRSGQVSLLDFHGQLLRIVYRLIFLFVAEDRTLEGRSLLHPIDDSEAGQLARDRYAAHYSTARLRELASKIKGSRHGDLWQQFNLLVGALAGDDRFAAPREHLALPILGSFLWSPSSTATLNAPSLTGGEGTELANADFLEALRHLAFTRMDKILRPVDYKNIGAEEIGGVYESLLALTPQISGDGVHFTFAEFAGNERKTSGSYYTPDCLVQCLLDSALDPVVAEALKDKTNVEAEKALLALKVCDPAVGSGHFLVGAAHRLARHLARVRAQAQGESEPSPLFYQHALRDIIGRCLYGVDINPMSAELCRVSLWLEALEPGKPLSFLDHHIRVGNSLLGATPALMANGIPDEVFDPITGDDKAIARAIRKRNHEERKRQTDMFLLMAAEKRAATKTLTERVSGIDSLDDGTIAGVHQKEERYRNLTALPEYQAARLEADAWCAAFVWRKTKDAPPAITEDVFRRLGADPKTIPAMIRNEVETLAKQYQFFHWHLAFPDVFRLPSQDEKAENEKYGWSGGFDVVLGNPPWERVKLEEKQWFASRSQEIVGAKTAAIRKHMIRDLEHSNPQLFNEFLFAQRSAEAESMFIRASNCYPLSGVGDVNTYAVFTELAAHLTCQKGCCGLIVPTGLLTDDQLKNFFSYLIKSKRLASVFGFENEEFLFPGIANVVRFCVIAITGPVNPVPQPHMAFYMRRAEHLDEQERYFAITQQDLSTLNPNTGTCPVFRTEHDKRLTLKLYQRFPILRRNESESGDWGITYLRMFDMANDSNLFLSEPAEDALPLYEAKLFWHYDHRFGSYDLKGKMKGKGGRGLPNIPLAYYQDPDYRITPQFWVKCSEVNNKLRQCWTRNWLLAYRTTSSAKLERTVVCSILPFSAVNHKAPLIFPGEHSQPVTFLLLSCLNSIVLDYAARQKVGGTDIGYFHIDQLPIPRPADFDEQQQSFLRCRVLELVFTSEDVLPFAIDHGWNGSPFRWDTDRRFLIQCEIDACYAHFYGLNREELMFILDPYDVYGPKFPGETFRVLKEKEINRWGEYRTKRVILEIYDAMAEAIKTGKPYKTLLDPPPADPRCAHPPRGTKNAR
ncbi:MAG: N-6 DNA methylase [Candidatus Aureabacteria bacterium]|nr:N-6 DNA methylase [Candidatus Auribacterota bacterium]